MTNLWKNGASSTASGVKRKAVINVSILDFVQLVLRIAVDVTVRERTVDDAVITPYIEELKINGSGSGSTDGESKRKKLCAPVTSTVLNNAEARKTARSLNNFRPNQNETYTAVW